MQITTSNYIINYKFSIVYKIYIDFGETKLKYVLS